MSNEFRDFHQYDTELEAFISNTEYCLDEEDKKSDLWIPFLSFPITQVCNFHCLYCGTGGEATASDTRMITAKQVKDIVDIALEKKIKKFRITGGEPFTHPQIKEILDIFNKCGCFTLINTNGSLILKNQDLIKNLKNNFRFAVSLDTLKPKKLDVISGYKKHQEIIEGIRLLAERNLLMRINMVVNTHNYDEIYDIIEFCKELKCDLKLLDVVSVPVPFGNRKSIYKEITSLEQEFFEHCDGIYSHEYTRGFGTPCVKYRFGKVNVTVKNSVKGSHYDREGENAICKNCPYFPCHEGLYDLFALADGRICSCRWTEKQMFNDTSAQIDYLIEAFRRSKFVQREENNDMIMRGDLAAKRRMHE